jgi:(p)ppGpp synthase/HD superfamily hydrolase
LTDQEQTPDLADAMLAAWDFAASAHLGQFVPGSELPYLKHLGAVAMEVLAAHQVEPMPDIALAVTCAILHDCIEDQGVEHSTLRKRFGPAVADGVQALSKLENLSKADAMADSLVRIERQPQAIWCVKLADRICNLRGAPEHWKPVRIERYREEARLILDRLGSAHRHLASRLSAHINRYPEPPAERSCAQPGNLA